MYIEFIFGIFLCILILAFLPIKSEEKHEQRRQKELLKEGYKEMAKKTKKDNGVKKHSQTELQKIANRFQDLMNKINSIKSPAKEDKVIMDTAKSYSSVELMLNDLHSCKDWSILDYIESYWHRYFWNFVSDIPLRVKTFIQRGMRGWADSDTWCFDFFLSKVISEGVLHLLKYGNTCWTKKDANALKEIMKTFKTAKQITNHNLIYTSSKKFTWKAYKKQKRTYKYMNKKYKGEKYRPMTLREVLRFEKGFDTFKEKFFFLWD